VHETRDGTVPQNYILLLLSKPHGHNGSVLVSTTHSRACHTTNAICSALFFDAFCAWPIVTFGTHHALDVTRLIRRADLTIASAALSMIVR
jgi:hypothetical protein